MVIRNCCCCVNLNLKTAISCRHARLGFYAERQIIFGTVQLVVTVFKLTASFHPQSYRLRSTRSRMSYIVHMCQRSRSELGEAFTKMYSYHILFRLAISAQGCVGLLHGSALGRQLTN